MSLRDQMLKAGLITEEQAKRAAHKQRQETKRTDPKERAARREASKAEVQRQQETQRERDRQAAQVRQQAEAERGKTLQVQQRRGSALEAAYREGAFAKWDGPRRYCYAAGGRIEWLQVSDDVGRKLEAGLAAICQGERNRARHVVLNAAAARTLRELDPERVLVWHQPEPSGPAAG